MISCCVCFFLLNLCFAHYIPWGFCATIFYSTNQPTSQRILAYGIFSHYESYEILAIHFKEIYIYSDILDEKLAYIYLRLSSLWFLIEKAMVFSNLYDQLKIIVEIVWQLIRSSLIIGVLILLPAIRKTFSFKIFFKLLCLNQLAVWKNGSYRNYLFIKSSTEKENRNSLE